MLLRPAAEASVLNSTEMEFSVKISSEHSSAISSLESFFVKPAESPG